MSDKDDIVPPSPPAHAQHAADVSWGDFLAALPATLAMHPEHERSDSAGRTSSRFALRRVVQGNAALPRAYRVARASARRERSAARRDALARPRFNDAEPVANQSSFPGAVSSPVVPGLPSDGDDATPRWLLSGLVLTGSVIVAVLTSVITVHAMKPAASPTQVASSPQPAVGVDPPVVISRDTSIAIQSPRNGDTTHALVATQNSGAPVSQESSDSVAAPSLEARPAPIPVRQAHASHASAQRAERHSLSSAEHARTSPRSTSVISSTRSVATTTVAPSPAVSSAPAPAASTTQQTAAPAATVPTGNNSAVLDELRAIHAEIDARKKHMDSLTAALDSLKRISKPD